jgi:hypothetical protein
LSPRTFNQIYGQRNSEISLKVSQTVLHSRNFCHSLYIRIAFLKNYYDKERLPHYHDGNFWLVIVYWRFSLNRFSPFLTITLTLFFETIGVHTPKNNNSIPSWQTSSLDLAHSEWLASENVRIFGHRECFQKKGNDVSGLPGCLSISSSHHGSQSISPSGLEGKSRSEWSSMSIDN